jgi:hypothetical protein
LQVRCWIAGLLCSSAMLSGCASLPVWEGHTAPFVALHVCRNQIDAHFPDLGDALVNEAVMAAEEWFVGGGAHVRLYYSGTLPASHPACADVPTTIEPRLVGSPPAGSRPPDRTVVLTAASSLTNRLNAPGTSRCEFAVVDRWEAGSSGPLRLGSTLQSVRITLARNQTCGGGLEPWPWPGGSPGSPPPTLSPARVLMKSFGSALGLGEVPISTDSVRNPIDPAVDVRRWHLTEADVQALRRAYGPSQSSQFWLQTRDGGTTWTVRPRVPRPNSRDSLGASGCRVVSQGGVPPESYLVAETVHQASGGSSVMTYLVDEQGLMLGTPVVHAPSNRKASVLCLGTGFLLGWVAPDGSVAIARSVDGWRWTRASLLAGWRSANAPVLAEARWGGALLAASSADDSGLRFMRSSDGGATFGDAGAANSSQHFRFPFGFSCAEAIRKCFVTGGDTGFVRMAFELISGQWRWVGTSGGGEVPNLGVVTTPTADEAGFAFVRRYKPGSRFYATPGGVLGQVGGGVQARGDANPYQFLSQPFSRAVSDSPPGLLRAAVTPGFIVLATHNTFYNSPFVLVPAPGQ